MASNNKTIITAEPGRQELFIVREFEAPRELVFKAFATPALIQKWLGPRDVKITLDYYKVETNGAYRYTGESCGMSFGFRGVIHEVTAPERIIQTFEFEGLPEKGHVSMETARFEALPNNRTRVIIQSIFQSVADRDGLVQSGMERGVIDSHERLDELFEAGLE
ncbi:SRPBCC family protein [Mucilaginibacter mali]|uniref:SRPBCC family protein n=1 Tax=Mucilaginibacter mali TaxID=2740462 RepID=A0A7D4TTD6_9SPHI|nr:SRPBCC family protein [Mucilaginibacter mali]QKJ28915.1 SRPBCC family protein [Mucilaginibacter mali]